MRHFVRCLLIFFLGLWPQLVRADEACDALGHLLLASDLMRIAADTGNDLETTYGPSIGASIRSSGTLTRDLEQRAPEKASAIRTLRDIAASALAFVSTGRAELATLDQTGRELGEDARQLYVDWTCDDPEPGPGNGDLDGGADGERDPSAGGIGRGGAAGFRAVWVAIGRDNPIERAVLLGCFVTSVILLPYLILRDRRRRRRAERHVCSSPTSLVVSDQRVAARFFDISITGARVLVDTVIPPGTELMIEISGEDHPARVARSGKGFAGLEFEQTLKRDILQGQLEEAQAGMLFPARKLA